jgi:lysozyme family protein
MQYPFATLGPEYASLLGQMKIRPERQREFENVGDKLVGFVQADRYQPVTDTLGIPQIFIAPSFEREASSNFNLSPAQGDPWREVSRHVPRGLGPYVSWLAAALASYRLNHLDRVGAANWLWALLAYYFELFNGFGYRRHGIHSPYLFGGTNLYTRGKFILDGVFDATHEDEQLGCLAMALVMTQMMPALQIPGLPVPTMPAPSIVPAPLPAPVGHGDVDEVHTAEWIQGGLERLGYPTGSIRQDGTADGHMGRKTFFAVEAFQRHALIRVDGIPGPQTVAAMDYALKAAPPA